MSVLTRYVSRTVLAAILAVLGVVLALDIMAAIIDGLGEIEGDYTFIEVVKYVLTTSPGRIYQNIPFSALIGCLIGLGVLAGSSELVIMRAAGVSLLRIVGFVLRPVVALILIGVVIGEYLVPYTDQLAEGRKAILQGEQSRMASDSGLWNREDNEFVHVNVILPNGQLYGVTRFDFDGNNRLLQSSFAESASYHGDHWLEEGVEITRFVDETAVTETMASRNWESSISPQLLRLVMLEPESLPMIELFQYSNYLEEQGQNAGSHWLAFWGKALQPVTTASLVLIAVSFIFGPLREATMGLRIFAGVITGIVFSTSQQLLGPASLVYGFPPLMSVLVPILLCVLVGGFMLRRAA